MSRPDFGKALDNLIPEYREKFSLPEINQLGLVVADVEKAALHLEEQGIAPFFIATGSPAFWLEREENVPGAQAIEFPRRPAPWR